VKRKMLVIAAGLILLLWTPWAFAATVTYSGAFNGPTDVTNQILSVSQFDPSLGTMLSVQFQLYATMTTQAHVTNDGDFYAGWDKMVYNFSLIGAGSYNDVAISASYAPVRIVGSGTPDRTFSFVYPGGGEYARIVSQPSWTQPGPTLTVTDSFTKSALLDFIGTGNLSFFLTTLNEDALAVGGLQTGGMPSPATFGNSSNILANVTATYEYTPVPVPDAIWLLGSGLVGLVGLKRRFQR
jgi:hypothetical protein